jgi:conjugative relaxase-like TrwC/TraI family protein
LHFSVRAAWDSSLLTRLWVGVLNIGRLAAGREEYYLSQVAEGVEDYYLASGESPGWWLGGGIESLGLAGEVAADDLRVVLAGRSPGGTQLGRAGRKTPGFDLTFRAPKSVSLLHALSSGGTRQAVLAAHEEAVNQAVGYLEAHACATRRGKGGRFVVPGDGFIAAGFRHLTSRAGDPALHTHVLIANLVQSEGWWGTLDGRLIYAESKTAAYLYHAVLRAELTRHLGVDWQPVRHGMADIAGVDRRVIDGFSTRRREILDILEARGERSAAAAQVATLTTRRAKTPVDRVELLRTWHTLADELGFDASTRAGLVGRTGPEQVGVPDLDAAALLGPHGITRQRSSFDRRDVVQAWCQALPHGGDVTVIETLTDDTLATPEVRPLAGSALEAAFTTSLHRQDGTRVPASPFGHHRFTTEELLETERHLVETAEARTNEGTAVVEDEIVEAALALRPSLGEEQRQMVRTLTTAGDGVAVVVGKAGAGKTLALDAARAAWQATGTTVIGCSLAARAAAQLEADAGIPSATIARLTRELQRNGLPVGSVVIVDEAAMVDTRTLAQLTELTAQAQAKLVLVGDDRQLPAIDAGGGFRALTRAVTPIRLQVNRRQAERWERTALDHLAGGDSHRALSAYAEHGRITTGDNAEAVRDQLVADWHANRLPVATDRCSPCTAATSTTSTPAPEDSSTPPASSPTPSSSSRAAATPSVTGSSAAATTTAPGSSTAPPAPSPPSTRRRRPSPSTPTTANSSDSRAPTWPLGTSTTPTPSPSTRPKAPPGTRPSSSATTASTAKPATSPSAAPATRPASTPSPATRPTSTTPGHRHPSTIDLAERSERAGRSTP